MSEKESKGRFLKAEKERRRREKVMVALLVFIIATLEIVFGRKKLSDAKGPSGDNVFKNRYKQLERLQDTSLSYTNPRKAGLARHKSLWGNKTQSTNKQIFLCK